MEMPETAKADSTTWRKMRLNFVAQPVAATPREKAAMNAVAFGGGVAQDLVG